VAEAAPGATSGWRDIGELAELVGAYCWLEHRIFELTGAWASAPATAEDPSAAGELRVWCAALSRRHGARAECWARRLPVRVGVDPHALVRAPAGPLAGALDALAAEPDGPTGAGALVETVLPCLQRVYEAHQATAAAASEGPVLEVLVRARREMAGEIRGGSALPGLSGGSKRGSRLRADIERAFDGTRVFPAVRAS
jgi:hypothetical protein